jgi:hypothetical protein
MATHPPLGERIQRIDPHFDGTFPEVQYGVEATVPRKQPRESKFVTEETITVVPHELTDLIGKLTDAHLAYAAALMTGLPERLTDKVHDPSGARAVVFALLLSKDSTVRQAQFRLLNESKDTMASRETLELSSLAERCPPQARLPLIDLTLPALRRLSPEQHRTFRGLVDRMVMADERCDLFEYAVLHLLRRHLDRYFLKTPPPTTQYHSLSSLASECSTLLSGLAIAGQGEEELARRAFEKGSEELADVGSGLTFHTRAECDLKSMSKALDKLALVSPTLKRQILRASAATVSHDQRVTIEEGELLRAIADALDCPMPPFLAGQDLTVGREST